MDFRLRHRMLSRRLADIDERRAFLRIPKQFLVHQAVIQDDIRLLDPPERLYRNELRITGTGADDRHHARLHRPRSADTAAASMEPRAPADPIAPDLLLPNPRMDT
ncbi:hypothetical protein J21TS7_46000 [Paenibacillus cineris]|uniref:Uncharacterized protein n=1 Tax=Paenibacillus cineris TaxID=237530 RepID=A0ABQ4LIM0_9BACL|nr:hypothetical protein J21TS7_46000 [Paenibacillus cineris]